MSFFPMFFFGLVYYHLVILFFQIRKNQIVIEINFVSPNLKSYLCYSMVFSFIVEISSKIEIKSLITLKSNELFDFQFEKSNKNF
jgi:hypothetical protein